MIPLLTAKVKSSKISVAPPPIKCRYWALTSSSFFGVAGTVLVTSPVGYAIGDTEHKTHNFISPPWLHVLFELNIYFLN